MPKKRNYFTCQNHSGHNFWLKFKSNNLLGFYMILLRFRMAILQFLFCVFAFFSLFLTSSTAFSLSFQFADRARKHIQVVGSSTVYPFTSVIAETFGRDTQFKTPIIESTGTGGGMKLFCSGVGYSFPDLSNASRAIKKSERKKCAENGIKDIIEVKVGYDGIVLANSKAGVKYNISKKQIFLALAQKVPSKDGLSLVDNYYEKWSDIDANLPNINIAIYGPPSTSGTRDAFVELVMEGVCKKMSAFKKAFSDKKIRKKKCHIMRGDGHFIEAGENDNLIVQKLKADKEALGIFGYSFLEENHKVVQAAKINGVNPSFKDIVSGKYSVSRPLFIYFKGEHLDLVPGIKEFIKEIVDKNTIGKDGYLLQKGLIPLSDREYRKVRFNVTRSLK